ncbi:3' exoribonuclease family, domain 1-domain-containing protein, partial [Protomyces lactucae-debilis]
VLRAGMIAKANGSAYLERDKIKIICAVHGPRQRTAASGASAAASATGGGSTTYAPVATVTCEFKYAPFARNRRQGYVRDNNERHLGTLVADALRPAIQTALYPKAEISLFLTILEEDGELATLAAAMLCASSALGDAGIPCFDLVSAACLIYLPNAPTASQICIDPSASDEEAAVGEQVGLVVAWMPSRQQTTLVHIEGQFASTKLAQELLQVATKQADLGSAIMRKALLEDV